MVAELGKILGAEIRQLVVLPVSPEEFHGVEFWGVCRQTLNAEPSSLLLNEVVDQAAAMGGQPVPDDQPLDAITAFAVPNPN